MKENNYLKQIVYIPILFSIFIAIVVLSLSKYNFISEFKVHLDKHLKLNIEKEKIVSKQKVINAFKYIKHIGNLFPDDIIKQKEIVKKYIQDQDDLERYIFVLDVININGGDKFAKMLVNPNQPDLIGKYLNDSYKDSKGKEFGKEFLEEIRQSGESFVTYYYKKFGTNENIKKISYFKYHPKFNWIIGAGIYLDDIKISIDEEQRLSLKEVDNRFINVLLILLVIIILYSTIIYFKMDKIKRLLENKNKNKKIKSKTKETKSQNKQINQHKNILQSIVKIQQELISNSEFSSSVEYILKDIIEILHVDRVYISENHLLNNELVCSQKFEYTKENISAQIDNLQLQNIPYSEEFIKRWKDILSLNKPIEGLVKDFPQAERDMLESQNIKSILVIPIFYENKWWGFIGFDDCISERIWTKIEKETLQIVTNSFISALTQDNYYKSLEKKVDEQINDIRKKDKMLIQQSKMASMGEMIGNIAHQWRQPLNVIGASAISLQIKYENDLITDEFIKIYITKLNETIQNMSHTINDFRNFFAPNKNKTDFDIKASIEETLNLLGESFKIHNVNISINCDKPYIINGYKNEFAQAILVILNNSKDAILQNNIKDGNIIIDILENNNKIKVIIKDNGGGIPSDILDNVCELYFTTKFKAQGTGIGLYMVKEIIENHMNGTIEIENYNDGVKTIIKI